jgi:hypothetical protein
LLNLLAILREATNVSATSTHGGVASPSGAIFPPGVTAKFPGDQVVTFDRVAMWVVGGDVCLSMCPGELKPQYTRLYSDPAKVEALIALTEQAGWELTANFHLAYPYAQPHLRWYPRPQLSGPKYVRQWVDDFRGGRTRGGSRERVQDASFGAWLVERSYAAEADLTNLDEWLNAKAPRTPIQIRPSVRVTRTWSSQDAAELDRKGEFATEVRAAIDQVLTALREPTLTALQPQSTSSQPPIRPPSPPISTKTDQASSTAETFESDRDLGESSSSGGRSGLVAHDVFVSYSHHDKPQADAVCATLEAKGIRCWMAPRDIVPGQEWGGAIVDAIQSSRVMVLVFSNHANASPQIRREVQLAVDAETVLIPFRIEDVAPSQSLKYFLGTPHWLDALTPPLEAHLERLSAAVASFLAVGIPEGAFGAESDLASKLSKPDSKKATERVPSAQDRIAAESVAAKGKTTRERAPTTDQGSSDAPEQSAREGARGVTKYAILAGIGLIAVVLGSVMHVSFAWTVGLNVLVIGLLGVAITRVKKSSKGD